MEEKYSKWPYNYSLKDKCILMVEDASLDEESWKILYNLIKDQIELRKTNDSSFKD